MIELVINKDRGALHKEYRTDKRQPMPCGKGVGAEADIVAGVGLAVRRISALLSCKRSAINIIVFCV